MLDDPPNVENTMALEAEGRIRVADLLELSGADRGAKAYAFLYAALKTSENSNNPVRDAIDCLIPFVGTYTNAHVGEQVTAQNVQKYLRDAFGFEIPLYAVEQMLPELQKQGYLKYSTVARIHVAERHQFDFSVARESIEVDFDSVARKLEDYATEVGFTSTPTAGSWEDALLSFLRDTSDSNAAAFKSVKNVLVDQRTIERTIVGNFISKTERDDRETFNKIVNVFMGILVEGFISSISEMKRVVAPGGVGVFYDTAVLMRVLGCSGKLHKIATEELTRYLQDLGYKIYYLPGNESEVANILQTIVTVKDSGGELENETAVAMANAEITLTDLRLLQSSFPDELAKKNIFSGETLEKSAQINKQFQIDETGFSRFLQSEAREKGRPYSEQNRQHDASYLGAVMRLRRGHRSRDIGECRFVFVTSNSFLARSAKRYLVKERHLSPQHVSAMMSLGQVATIAWLLKDHKLNPAKAGRELLVNCYSAIRPDAEWFRHFRAGLERVVGPVDEYVADHNHALVVQAARRISTVESFGNSQILRQLSIAEILGRAEADAQRKLATAEARQEEERQERETERTAHEAEKAKLLLESQAKLNLRLADEQRKGLEAVAQAKKDAETDALQRFEEADRVKRLTAGRKIVKIVKFIVAILFVMATLVSLSPHRNAYTIGAAIVLALFGVLSTLDALGIHKIESILDRLSERIGRAFP